MKKTPLAYARELYVQMAEGNDREARASVRALLAELARARKTALVPRIAEAFRYVALAAEGRRPGRIVTARELDKHASGKLAKAFADVAFEESVEPELIGGAVIRVEDLRIDASVRGQIERVKAALRGQ